MFSALAHDDSELLDASEECSELELENNKNIKLNFYQQRQTWKTLKPISNHACFCHLLKLTSEAHAAASESALL